ncbi:hypothetical protein P3T76_007752 [Phytophthora citrophthora]|uniref:Uncharacterized protein n=1 Tax=Phytophthora citrophthora TaxID=4793 RepID=A0AAD9LM61_9STRA|nr:hypothetical protein P3T76_007752 [Phytophthora citrophthora]
MLMFCQHETASLRNGGPDLEMCVAFGYEACLRAGPQVSQVNNMLFTVVSVSGDSTNTSLTTTKLSDGTANPATSNNITFSTGKANTTTTESRRQYQLLRKNYRCMFEQYQGINAAQEIIPGVE